MTWRMINWVYDTARSPVGRSNCRAVSRIIVAIGDKIDGALPIGK